VVTRARVGCSAAYAVWIVRKKPINKANRITISHQRGCGTFQPEKSLAATGNRAT
jgi:hypothetical protein